MTLSHDVLIIANSEGKIIRANPRFTQLFGYTIAQMGRLAFLDLMGEGDRADVRTIMLGLLRAGERDAQGAIDFHARSLTCIGEVRWMEWRIRRSGDEIVALGQDVTETKTREVKLLLQQQQLAEAQAIGRMGHWMWRTGEDQIAWSDELYRMFGVTRENFVPTIESLKSMLHRRDVGRMAQAFERAMIERNNFEMEFRIFRPEGVMRILRCEGRCEIDTIGDVVALFGIMQDMTERTQHEHDLRIAKEAAERAYAAKSQFLANMSHELRTPLNAIIGFSEMIERQLLGPLGTDKYLDYIECIRESGEHLLDLISDILDMSKIEAGKYQLDLEKINLSKVLTLAVHMIEGRALEAKVALVFPPVSETLEIVADRRAMLQIVLNLLSNAVKFTKPGGSVTLEAHQDKDQIVMCVSDTGIGIPAHMIAHVTKPFEQVASEYTRAHQGTGLGLSITKELVEMHGGSLKIDSTVDVGTSVTVHLPLLPPQRKN